MQVNLVLAAGIVYSVIGALLMYLSHRSLYRKAIRCVAGYPRDLAALRIQQHDGRYGVIILMCGNILQVFAACGYAVSPQYWRYPSVTLVGVMGLYVLWRMLARRSSRAEAVAMERRAVDRTSITYAHRVFETRRSAVLLEAAIREEANRRAREAAKGPRDRSVVYVKQDWECRWWSDRFGVTPAMLRAAVRSVGPMVADVERYLALRSTPKYVRSAYARAA